MICRAASDVLGPLDHAKNRNWTTPRRRRGQYEASTAQPESDSSAQRNAPMAGGAATNERMSAREDHFRGSNVSRVKRTTGSSVTHRHSSGGVGSILPPAYVRVWRSHSIL